VPTGQTLTAPGNPHKAVFVTRKPASRQRPASHLSSHAAPAGMQQFLACVSTSALAKRLDESAIRTRKSPGYPRRVPAVKKKKTYTDWNMRRVTSFVAIFILLSAAAPLLACMTGSSMNRKESACCRAMYGNCGEMAKTGCCHIEVRPDGHPQLATSPPTIDFHLTVVDRLAPFVAASQNASPLHTSDEHSPPDLVTARITVLRI
jgi:hypothetical protein